MEYHNKH